MKCENTRPAIQRIAVKYYGFEEVLRGGQLSHAALIMVHPQTCTSRTISPGLPFVGCCAPADRRGLTDDSQKNQGERLPLAETAHVPAGVFKVFSPPDRQINIWMIMIALGWELRMVEEGSCAREASSSVCCLAGSIYLQVCIYLPLAAA